MDSHNMAASAAARKSSPPDLTKYVDWVPERDDVDDPEQPRGDEPNLTLRRRPARGLTRVRFDELAAALVEHTGACRVDHEDKVHEEIAALRTLAERDLRVVLPRAGSWTWWAERLVARERIRLDMSDATKLEGKHRHRTRHRGQRLKKLDGYSKQLATRVKGEPKSPAQRWARKAVERAVDHGLLEGGWADGIRFPKWVRAVAEVDRGLKLDIRLGDAPDWIRAAVGTPESPENRAAATNGQAERRAAVGTREATQPLENTSARAAVGTQKGLSKSVVGNRKPQTKSEVSMPPAVASARSARVAATRAARPSGSTPRKLKTSLGVDVPHEVFELLRDDGFDVERVGRDVAADAADLDKVRLAVRPSRVPVRIHEEVLLEEFGFSHRHVRNGSAEVPRIVAENLRVRLAETRGMKTCDA